MIIKRAAQLQSADQRIIGNKRVGPDLHQFLLADQPPRMFHKYLSASYTFDEA
jgi:hypothetical protein